MKITIEVKDLNRTYHQELIREFGHFLATGGMSYEFEFDDGTKGKMKVKE